MIKFRLIILVILTVVFNRDLFSQIKNYKLKKLTIEDGLSHVSNYDRYEDSKGFMWLSSFNGLNRFDGNSVKIYNSEKKFKSNKILRKSLGFVEDENSDIYIGSSDGLYKYIRKKDVFVEINEINKWTQNVHPIGIVSEKLWLFNSKLELFQLDLKSNDINKITWINYKDNNYVNDIGASVNNYPVIDIQYNIWFLINNELVNYNTKQFTFDKPLRKLITEDVISFCYDKYLHKLHFTTLTHFYTFDIKSNKISNVVLNSKFLTGQKVLGISCSKNFIGYVYGQHLVIANKNFKDSIVVDLLNEDISWFGMLNFDKHQRLWGLENGKKILIFNFIKPFFNSLVNFNQSKNKPSSIGRIYEDVNGQIFVLNNRDFSLFINKKNNIESIQLFDKECLYSNFIKNEFTNKDYYLRVSESFNEFYEKNNENKFNLIGRNLLPIELGTITHAIFIDTNNILFANLKSLFIFNTLNKSISYIKNLPEGRPYYINALGKDTFAISFRLGGVWIIEYKNQNIKFVKNTLKNEEVFFLISDKLNKVYWASGMFGLYQLDNEFNCVKKFNSNSGLSGDLIIGMLMDRYNNLWLSHQKGLSVVNTSTLAIANFSPKDGLQDWDFNDRSFVFAKDGSLYFGGIKGLNYFKPPYFPINNYKSKLYIDELLVNNQYAYELDYLNQQLEIQLKENENTLKFKCCICDLDMDNNQVFYYRIQNETGWQRIEGDILELANISFNTTWLELGLLDDKSNKIVTSHKIKIKRNRPFYKSFLFWLTMFIGVVSVVFYLVFKNKLIKKEQDFKKQIEIEKEKNKITADLHDDLGATLSSLQINSNIANQILETKPEKAKEILNKIEKQSNLISEKLSDIVWSLKPNKDSFMLLSERIKKYVIEVFEATEINFDIQIDELVDKEISNSFQKKNVLLFVKEATNNAAKYSKATSFKIKIYLNNGLIYILIEDNGVGFDVNTKKGNGLTNLSQRAKELNAKKFIIKSEPNKGCQIDLSFMAIP